MTTQTRSFSWVDPIKLAALRQTMSGFEFFDRMAKGDIPPAPIYQAIGFELIELGKDYGRIECAIGRHHYNPLGIAHGGVAATLIDTAAGISIQSELEEGFTPVTVNLRVDYLRAMTEATGTVKCEARVAKRGRQICLADAEITDANGRSYARGSGTFYITERKHEIDAPLSNKSANGESSDLGVERERIVEWTSAEELQRLAQQKTGHDLLTSMAAGNIPPPAISRLIDMALAEVGDGEVTFTTVPSEIHYNPMGLVHGGLQGILLDSATGLAVFTQVPEGHAFTTIDLSVDYYKPLTLDSGPVRCHGRVVRGGRRIAVADGEVVGADGTVYARGSSTCLVFPKRQ